MLDTGSSANLDAEEKGDAMYLLSDQILDMCDYYLGKASGRNLGGELLKGMAEHHLCRRRVHRTELSMLADTSGAGYQAGLKYELVPDVGGVKAFAPFRQRDGEYPVWF